MTTEQARCQPNHIFMQVNGFELWQALLDHAVDITPELAELAPMAVDLMIGNSQELETVLRIVDGYITSNNGHFVKVSRKCHKHVRRTDEGWPGAFGPHICQRCGSAGPGRG